MKVKELIKILECADEDAEIIAPIPWYDPMGMDISAIIGSSQGEPLVYIYSNLTDHGHVELPEAIMDDLHVGHIHRNR